MRNNKVSIIIPTYNRSSYLRRAVESVLNQDHTNLEVIIVDDGSTDDTEEMISSLDDERIVYLPNEKNMGANASRNRGLRNVDGDYVGFLDDDDYYKDVEKLTKQLSLFEKDPTLAFVGCGYYDISIGEDRYPSMRGEVADELLLSFSNVETSTILIRGDIVDRVGFFDETLPSEQNHDFFYRIAKQGSFDYVDEVMVFKDAPPTQISRNPEKKVRGYVHFHRKHFEDIKKLPLKKRFFAYGKFLFVFSMFSAAMIFPGFIYLVRRLDVSL